MGWWGGGNTHNMDVMIHEPVSGCRCISFVGDSGGNCNRAVIMWVDYFPWLFISVTSDYGEWDSLHFWPAPPEGGQNYLSVSSWDCKLGWASPAWRPMKPLFLSTGWLLYIIWKLGPLITSLCGAIHQAAAAYRRPAAGKRDGTRCVIIFKNLQRRKKKHTHYACFIVGSRGYTDQPLGRITHLVTHDHNNMPPN